MSDRPADGESQRILWGVGTSRTIRAHWALHELDLSYELRPILPRTGETQTEQYSTLTARQKIPLLQDQGQVITESAAIVSYLSDVYGQAHNRLMPIETLDRAKCLEWCFFVISELDATSLYVMRRHRDLAHIYGEAPQANAAAVEYFGKQMRAVDRVLSDGRPYLLGDRFSAADMLLSSCLTWAVRYQVPVSPEALQYNRALVERDAFKRADRRNTPAPAQS